MSAGGDGVVVDPGSGVGLKAVRTACPGGIVIVADLIYKSIAGVANPAKVFAAAFLAISATLVPCGLFAIVSAKTNIALSNASSKATFNRIGTRAIFILF